MDTESGVDIVEYKEDKDQLLVNQRLIEGPFGTFNFYLQAETALGWLVHYPVQITLTQHVNEMPKFETELDAGITFTALEANQIAGETQVYRYESPGLVDLEGDAPEIVFSGPGYEENEAVTCEQLKNYFVCTIDEALVTPDNSNIDGIVDLTVDIFDDGDDPREVASHKFKIEIKYTLAAEEPVAEEGTSEEAEESTEEIDTSGMSEEERE
jgi:hypothetical protein